MRITNAKLKNGKNLQFGDINIFVGPNGVGKTTLMNEIREFFCAGSLSTSYWVTSLQNSDLESTDALILLKYIKESTEINNLDQEIKKYTLSHNRNSIGKYETHSGSVTYSEDIYNNLVALSMGEKDNIELSNRPFIHRIFIEHEDTRQRLSLNGEGSITDSKFPLRDTINLIVRNKEFQESLNTAFLRCFSHNLFFSTHRGMIIETLVNKVKDTPIDIEEFSRKSFEEFEKIKKEQGIFTIDKVGDGMLAGAKLFFSLFSPDSKIIFIDEPEVFIHPKQKINIAKQLKELAEKNKKQLFFSTHDATFLSGLIDNKDEKIKVNIFYLKDHEKIISLENFLVGDEKIKPTTKHQKYLQSLFHDGTIFVESPNDRCFYEHAIGELFKKRLTQKDIVFTDLTGASTALEIAQFVKDSEIKAVFLFDNVIKKKKVDQQSLSTIYKYLGGKKDLEKILEELPSKEKEIKEELEKYGIFSAPIEDLSSWSSSIKKYSDGFPYNLIEEIVAKPTTDFKLFIGKVLDFLIPI